MDNSTLKIWRKMQAEHKSSSLHKVNIDSKGQITKGKIIDVKDVESLVLYKGKIKIADIDLKKEVDTEKNIKERLSSFEKKRKDHIKIIIKNTARSLSLTLVDEIIKELSDNEINRMEEKEHKIIERILEELKNDKDYISDKVKFKIEDNEQ